MEGGEGDGGRRPFSFEFVRGNKRDSLSQVVVTKSTYSKIVKCLI
jgi:hypothetical protein